LLTLRVFPVVRSAHIDDLNAAKARPTFFFEVTYDAEGRVLPADWSRYSLIQLLRQLWKSPPASLELFEPLWFRFLSRWIAVALIFRVRTRGTASTLGFYAIENSALVDVTPGPVRLRPVTVRLYRRFLSFLISRLVDRIAFGTDAAAATYSDLVDGSVDTVVIHDLRRPRAGSVAAKTPGFVSFVGALEARKGLPELMEAWSEVEARHPHARLHIIGDGALREEAASWVAQRPQTRILCGRLPHHEVISTLHTTQVFVLPSQRKKGWREQVGLGIVEALSCGCTVVSTDETGVAAWLVANGHYVIAADETYACLGIAIAAAVELPIEPASVLASLPAQDGRVKADAWLHRPA
jgi:glycosyltransferase involved in cell wall biosynthesis